MHAIYSSTCSLPIYKMNPPPNLLVASYTFYIPPDPSTVSLPTAKSGLPVGIVRLVKKELKSLPRKLKRICWSGLSDGRLNLLRNGFGNQSPFSFARLLPVFNAIYKLAWQKRGELGIIIISCDVRSYMYMCGGIQHSYFSRRWWNFCFLKLTLTPVHTACN